MTKDTGVELQLEVRQAPLAQVFASIASKTGVRINYSVLPEELVTATCVGSTVKQVMECLLIGKADLVYRYARQASKPDPKRQPEEVWVLGAKFGTDQSNSVVCPSTGNQQHEFQVAASNSITGPEPDHTDELLTMARSNVPTERVEAIGRLMSGGRKGDAAVKATLEAALLDPDARVRVRAISSLAHREGAGAAPALQEALRDSDASVRITAVDNAGSDIPLLKQALTDNDSTVRQLAEIKLAPLLKADAQ
jgi:HEAT repeat protein